MLTVTLGTSRNPREKCNQISRTLRWTYSSSTKSKTIEDIINAYETCTQATNPDSGVSEYDALVN